MEIPTQENPVQNITEKVNKNNRSLVYTIIGLIVFAILILKVIIPGILPEKFGDALSFLPYLLFVIAPLFFIFIITTAIFGIKFIGKSLSTYRKIEKVNEDRSIKQELKKSRAKNAFTLLVGFLLLAPLVLPLIVSVIEKKSNQAVLEQNNQATLDDYSKTRESATKALLSADFFGYANWIKERFGSYKGLANNGSCTNPTKGSFFYPEENTYSYKYENEYKNIDPRYIFNPEKFPMPKNTKCFYDNGLFAVQVQSFLYPQRFYCIDSNEMVVKTVLKEITGPSCNN